MDKRPTEAGRASRPKIGPLTTVRFLAAFFVVVYHTYTNAGFHVPEWFRQLMAMGPLSVSFFFVLSGYILAVVYLGEDRPVDRRRFWVARFARVYPLFLAMTLADTPWLLMERAVRYGWAVAMKKTLVTFAVTAVMLHGWSGRFDGINIPSWSLSDEAFFYALFPFIALAIWRLRLRWSVALAFGCYAGTMVVTWYLQRRGWSTFSLGRMPLLRTSEFVVGLVAARCHVQARQAGHEGRLSRMALPLILAGVFVTCLVDFTGGVEPEFRRQPTLLAPAFAMMVVGLASLPKAISRLFSTSWGILLGESSFGLYLIHVPLIRLFRAMHLGYEPVSYFVFLAVAVGLSIASFLYFEGPARAWILRVAAARDREGPVLSSLAQ